MRCSLTWLKSFLPVSLSNIDLMDQLTSLGLEVEGSELVQSHLNGFAQIVCGEVITCEKHPNADKLKCTTVSTGSNALKIVCGAPNVAVGQKVWVALPGALVYGKDKSTFTIGIGKIRGEVSEGMICAGDELGLSSDHSGILVLPDSVVVGTTAKEYYQVQEEEICEIGLTPNRADGMYHLGIAQDLHARLVFQNKFSGGILFPPSTNIPIQEKGPLEIVIDPATGCRAFYAASIQGVQVAPSPNWLVWRLQVLGLKSINNVVDITNLVLQEYGQPLHAYDAAKIGGRGIHVRTLPEGTPFTTLDGVERKLHAEDVMICDATNKPLCMAGVFGGDESGVNSATTNIILEAAWFDPGSIRRSMIRHDLRTDAARRFEKGADQSILATAMQRAITLILEVAGGACTSGIWKQEPQMPNYPSITCSLSKIQQWTGISWTQEQITQITTLLDMQPEWKGGDLFIVQGTGSKPDVLRPVDVTEEILRIAGYDTLPQLQRIPISLTSQPMETLPVLGERLAEWLCAQGFSEAMHMSLGQAIHFQELPPPGNFVTIQNTGSVTQDTMRTSLLPGLCQSVGYQQKRQMMDIRLFETGKIYYHTESGTQEHWMAAWIWSGSRTLEQWNAPAKNVVDIFTMKGMLDACMQYFGVQLECTPSKHPVLVDGLEYLHNKKSIARIGRISSSFQKILDVKGTVWYAEVNLESLVHVLPARQFAVQDVPKFPSVRRDVAMILDHHWEFDQLKQLAEMTFEKSKGGEQVRLEQIQLFDVYRNADQLGVDKKSYALSFQFRHQERTLQSEEVDRWMNSIQNQMIEKTQGRLRS